MLPYLFLRCRSFFPSSSKRHRVAFQGCRCDPALAFSAVLISYLLLTRWTPHRPPLTAGPSYCVHTSLSRLTRGAHWRPWPFPIRLVPFKPFIIICRLRPRVRRILSLLPQPWVIQGMHVCHLATVRPHSSVVLHATEFFGRLDGCRSPFIHSFRKVLTKPWTKPHVDAHPVKIWKDSSRCLGPHELLTSQAFMKLCTNLFAV